MDAEIPADAGGLELSWRRIHHIMSEVIPSGATGFDRIATVVVACRGRSLASLNTEHKLPANTSDVAGRVGFQAASVRMAA